MFENDFLQWLEDRLGELRAAFEPLLAPLFNLIGITPLEMTTQHAIVQQGWLVMTLAADLLLGLFIVCGVLQLMYGQTTGQLSMPLGEFLGRAILTVLLIHLSAFLGETLLTINNALCDAVRGIFTQFVIEQILAGNDLVFTNIGTAVFSVVLGIFAGIGIFRVVFQAVRRIICFNVLFVLSGPAFLMSFHPSTSLIFSIWMRMYIITIFEQFIQLLTLALGFQFAVVAKPAGLLGFVLAIAMLNFAAEIPALLTRFGSAATGGGRAGLSSVVTALTRFSFLFR